MEYLALYRKYRPSVIDEVVGQEEIKKILSTSIKNKTISHAYLFSGPRGTGKTTMAKIFAKMVNCEHPVDGHPCNECECCKNLFINNDVIEIDAASNNGVDEIRELREKANLVPSICKYKVYIVDEVHMLSLAAFNALLKTLEEPPKHVIFILATTEYHKIPATISSRCQKFQFNKIDNDDIVLKLKEISNKENILIDADALCEIAKISDGGMRDSINFLDQLRSYTNKKITIVDVYNVCGYVSLEEISNLFENIKSDNASEIIEFFERLSNNGKSYNKFLEDLLNFLNNVIMYKSGVSKDLIKIEDSVLKKVSLKYSVKDIFYIIDVINKLLEKLKFASRQSVIVISNFLLIMNEMSEKSIIETKKECTDQEYEVSFDFTSNAVDLTVDEKKVSLQKNVTNDNKDIDEILKNKDIIINNTFAVANKNVKTSLHDKFTSVSDYLTDKKYSLVSGLLIDTNIEVAGDEYVIFTGNYNAVVDNIYSNYKLCSELINKLFDGIYNVVFISTDEWNIIKDEYIKNIKSGKKYEIKPLNIVETKKADKKKVTTVDKLFEIVGEENVEFK